MRAPLRAKGHELFTPSYGGLGERFRCLSPSVGLSTHVDDVAALLFSEDLTGVKFEKLLEQVPALKNAMGKGDDKKPDASA